jgi:hypothetical protein
MPEINRQYPIGKFVRKDSYTVDDIALSLFQLETLPYRLDQVLLRFTAHQLDTAYRDGGWTARQVIHHLADSHMNAYIRCKWTITESTPVIKAYDEKAWADTPDNQADPLLSLKFLEALHTKWVVLLKSLTATDLEKSFVHPETKRQMRLDQLIALYAWHGEHHLAHLNLILE